MYAIEGEEGWISPFNSVWRRNKERIETVSLLQHLFLLLNVSLSWNCWEGHDGPLRCMPKFSHVNHWEFFSLNLFPSFWSLADSPLHYILYAPYLATVTYMVLFCPSHANFTCTNTRQNTVEESKWSTLCNIYVALEGCLYNASSLTYM